jgi:hypothetical protein
MTKPSRPDSTPGLNPLYPTTSILCKLGSIALEVENVVKPLAPLFDFSEVMALLNDGEVQEWLHEMRKRMLVPIGGSRTRIEGVGNDKRV